jgi:acyl-CoA synthetase (AMP-forming)/AMP-acid ligase II
MIRTELIRPVPELLAGHAEQQEGELAFRDDSLEIGYGELFERTGRLAGHLRSFGVEPGDRVAIYAGNRVETAESYLAIPRAGGVAMCVNPRAAPREVAFMLSDSGARVLLVDDEHLDRGLELAQETGAVEKVIVIGTAAENAVAYDDLVAEDPPRPAPDDLDLDAPAWMLYTSGTTGRPKGVLLSQRSCLWVVAACWAPIVGVGAGEHLLSPLPLFHSYALDLAVLGVAATGASERVLPGFSPKHVIELLRSEPITVFPGVPTMFQYLVDALDGEPLDAHSLRVCVSAGAILPAALNEAFEDAAGVPLLDGYGITETSTMVTMNWLEGDRPRGSCGLPVPGSSVRIVDPASGEERPPGEDGELWVRGPHVMLGYHERPDETDEVLAGGWYHTGDLARADEAGFLTISGRIKELIIRGGENVYPAEVEAVLAEHPAIADVAVVAKPDEALGEVPVAFAIPREEPLEPDHVLEYCREHLSDYKLPAEIRTVDEIPRTGSGKIMRHRLQELL